MLLGHFWFWMFDGPLLLLCYAYLLWEWGLIVREQREPFYVHHWTKVVTDVVPQRCEPFQQRIEIKQRFTFPRSLPHPTTHPPTQSMWSHTVIAAWVIAVHMQCCCYKCKAFNDAVTALSHLHKKNRLECCNWLQHTVSQNLHQMCIIDV